MPVRAPELSPPSRSHPQALGLRPGELVRVRSPLEIGPTLDVDGSLDGMPFMPEMLQFCGRTARVSMRADKTCAGDGAPRRMLNTVHLANLRCDGTGHDGCDAGCLLFWKEAWLERVEDDASSLETPSPDDPSRLVDSLASTTRAPSSNGTKLYRCQATEIPNASTPLRLRQLEQYPADVRNWGLGKIVRGLLVEVFNVWQRFSKRHFPRALRIAGGRPYPFMSGALPVRKGATPSAQLNLRPGELVRVKSKAEIEATLDQALKNRGLGFDSEMIRYCGRIARVHGRVNRLVDEHTGKMIEINSDCIVLEGVVCASDYHRFCPRGIYSYWREIWLERVEDPTTNGAPPGPG